MLAYELQTSIRIDCVVTARAVAHSLSFFFFNSSQFIAYAFFTYTHFCSIFVAHSAFHHVFAIYRFIRSERDALNALRVHIHLIRATVMVFQFSMY